MRLLRYLADLFWPRRSQIDPMVVAALHYWPEDEK